MHRVKCDRMKSVLRALLEKFLPARGDRRGDGAGHLPARRPNPQPPAPVATPTSDSRSRLSASTIGAVAVFVLFWVVQGALEIDHARDHDFLNLYIGASIAREGNFSELHDPELQLKKEQEFVPHIVEVVPFVRPAFYAGLLVPLTFLPRESAFWCWLLLQFAILMACWRWAWRRFGADALVFGAIYFPSAIGIANGQDGTFILAAAVVSCALAEQGKQVWSGAALALTLIKFHLLLLAPLVMLLRGRTKMFLGYTVVAIAEIGVSLLLGGFGGAEKYLHLLLAGEVEGVWPVPGLAISVHAIGRNFGVTSPGLSLGLSLGLVAVVLILVGLAAWRAPYWRWFSAAVAGSLVGAPHVFRYDATVLLLPLWLVIFSSKDKFSRFVALLLLVPIPYFAAAFGPPWGIVPPLAIILLLAALARENVRSHSVSS